MAEPIEQHISPVDAFTLTLERDPLLRATIVAVAALTVRRTGTRSGTGSTARHAWRRVFREKLITVPFGLAPQRWVVDENFDLSLHLHRMRVPDGGGLREVLDVARAAGLTAFDDDRPLWEFTLVEGLPDGRAALVMKLHHALTTGWVASRSPPTSSTWNGSRRRGPPCHLRPHLATTACSRSSATPSTTTGVA